jgi:hypothetical protein
MTDRDAKARARAKPWWAVLTIWVVVNSVNVLQAAGFLSRISTGERDINHILGYVIVALALPAAAALVAFARSGAGWLHMSGPATFIAFAALALAVDYVRPVEFRDPFLPAVLVPYLVLFFGSIFLMGVPMYRIDKRRWFVTVTTTVLLIGAMLLAMQAGVG